MTTNHEEAVCLPKEYVDLDTPVIEMRNIVKRFGDVPANDGINLTVHKGEIHAILGENGAGKSTLMNQLYGLYRPTSGTILINGKKAEMNSPRDAIDAGIGMIHQHFMLVQPFTVTENIILGEEPKKGMTLDMETARCRVRELSERYGLSVDPDARTEDISVGMQQRVEILKALYRDADILILDEPTSSLTPQETVELIEIMRSLTRDGKSIIFITHKLKEIKKAADFCTIIRSGRSVATVDVDTASESSLADMMVGRSVSFSVDKPENKPGEVVLDVRDLHCLDYRGVEILKGIDLQVHAGEIVGIAGIDGNGQTELVEVLTGLRRGVSGQVLVNGTDVFNRSPRFGFRHGVSSIPADRQKHGLVLEFPVEDNLILQNHRDEPFSRRGVLRRGPISDYAARSIEAFDIRPRGSEKRPAGTLSGGNQQKVIIAREVQNDKDLLIAVNPTRGLDVGAVEYVHEHIIAQRSKGKAVLLVSFELDEIMSLSDTIAVIFDGRIVSSIPGSRADVNELGLMMAGGKKHE